MMFYSKLFLKFIPLVQYKISTNAGVILRRIIWFLMPATCFIACGFSRDQPNINEAIAGNWLVLYPDHQRNNAIQTAIYAKAQDSIVNLMGLKLITFTEDGKCQLIDSLYRQTGNWKVYLNELAVNGAGKGWESFDPSLYNAQAFNPSSQLRK